MVILRKPKHFSTNINLFSDFRKDTRHLGRYQSTDHLARSTGCDTQSGGMKNFRQIISSWSLAKILLQVLNSNKFVYAL